MHKQILWIIFILLLVACGASSPQIVTVGVINHAAVTEPALDGFKVGMTALGYVEGENITYLYEGATGSLDNLDLVADRLVELDVDLILALSTPATQAAQRAAINSDIPILFAPSSNPVEANLVQSLMYPGGNTTGVAFGLQEGKRLEWLLRIVPDVQRVYFPYNPDDKSAAVGLEKLRPAAEALGVELLVHEIHSADELTMAVEAIPLAADAIWIPVDALVASRTDEFAAVALAKQLPLTAPQRSGTEEGALFSYGFSLFHLGEQAAEQADLIFNGVLPADLPVKTAEFELTINLQTAVLLNLDIPDDILEEADSIIR